MDRVNLRRVESLLQTQSRRVEDARLLFLEQRLLETIPLWMVVKMRELEERTHDALEMVQSLLSRPPEESVLIDSIMSESSR